MVMVLVVLLVGRGNGKYGGSVVLPVVVAIPTIDNDHHRLLYRSRRQQQWNKDASSSQLTRL